MAGMETVLERLRMATVAEHQAFARALGYDLSKAARELGVDSTADPNSAALLLAKAYKEVAKSDAYRDTLITVAKQVAQQAEWSEPKIVDDTASDWIEDYIYLALGFVHLPNHGEFDPNMKAELQAKAVDALNGGGPSAEEETSAWASAIGAGVAVGLGFALGWWIAAPLGALTIVGWLLSPPMKKLVPSTLVLIHIRKRMEFEAVLGGAGVAA